MAELSLRQRMTEGVRGRVLSLAQNPIMLKELRSRMRGSRAFVVLTVYLLFMVSLIALIYIPITLAIQSRSGPDLADVGKFVFAMIVLVQISLVAFIAPAFTAGAISGEKQNQSYDLLRTTLLTPRQLVTGKTLSALGYVFLLVFASVPLQSIAFLLGGIALPELLIAELLVLVSAVAYALIGLYFSTVIRTTIGSTAATYAAAIFLLVGIPFTLLFFTWMNEVVFYSYSLFAGSWQIEALFQYGMMGLASFNLPLTVAVSEISLLEHNSYWGFTSSVSGGGYSSISHTIWLPSPWYLYLFWYSLIALWLYLACVRRISRIPN
jgi:ABC-type transport system involved in multi-copper enzyme maturation permease subunit